MTEATHDLLIDLHDDLLTVAEAATDCHVSEAAIRQWKRRGHLVPAAHDHVGRPLFRGIDVLRAEARAAANLRRTQVVNLSTRRASSET